MSPSCDEAWHVLEGDLTFRYFDRTETAGPGTTVFVPAGVAHTFTAGDKARYLIVLTPRLSALIGALQADRDPRASTRLTAVSILSCSRNFPRRDGPPNARPIPSFKNYGPTLM